MKVDVKGFIYHKDAETYQDCFDRYAINTSNHKFSVSDGVSKSFFPGIWAELLVESFVNTSGAVDLVNTGLLKNIQKKWNELVSEIVSRPNQKYYVRNFYAEGRSAAATFVGLDFFSDNGKLYWEAFALGDSFLFFVPERIFDLNTQFDEIIFISSKTSLEFDNFPDFFDSRNLANKGKIKQTKHELRAGTFYLMTDALSEWFVTEKQSALNEIRTWRSQDQFEQRISDLRKDQLQDDDSAILIIDISDDNTVNLTYGDILIADLKKLASNLNGEPGISSNIYEDEVRSIERKFSAQSQETNNEKKTSQQSIEHQSNSQDYLKEKSRLKKKKRGFWERKIDKIVNYFSVKDQITNDHKNDDIVSERNISQQSYDSPNKNNNNSQDFDSITNKF